MKHLPLISVIGQIISACTNDESDVFSFMEKDLESYQTRDNEENDSTGSTGIGFILEPDEFEEEIEEVNL